VDNAKDSDELAKIGAGFAADLPEYIGMNWNGAQLTLADMARASGTTISSLVAATFVGVFSKYGPERATQWFDATLKDAAVSIDARLKELGYKAEFSVGTFFKRKSGDEDVRGKAR